jgi:GWxTD domain-containing protein
MVLYSSKTRVAVFLIPFLCAQAIFAQDDPLAKEKSLSPAQVGIAPEWQYHPCFESRDSGKEANRRLPTSARDWLAEDVSYIILPEERCAFLRLGTDEERNQFIEQFWYRRAADAISPGYDFNTEHYRRIAYANEKYGGQITGWKTDRGRVYVLFGPPDSVEELREQVAGNTASGQTTETQTYPSQRWHYHCIKGLGENVQLDFVYRTSRNEYVLREDENDRLGQADLTPDGLAVTAEQLRLRIAAHQLAMTRFKDLEAMVTARVVRDQVKFSHRVEFSPATQATTLARIEIEIRCDSCAGDGQIPPASWAYPVFVRVSKASGWVVATAEQTADVRVSGSLWAHVDVPLAPGVYELAIVAKNPSTGEAGVFRGQMEVPTFESLEKRRFSAVP